MEENFGVLKKEFKKIAETLGPEWNITYYKPDYADEEDDWSDYQSIEFSQDGKEGVFLTVHHHDEDVLDITSRTKPLFNILFGPVEHIHFQTEEPKVIIESFVGEWVNCIELASDGTFRELHHLPKKSYRVTLHPGT